MARAHATAVTARIVFHKKSNGSDEVAWTDFSLVKLTGTIGFSDSPSENAYALPMKTFETPKAPRSASKVANRLLVYGVYKDANNPSELESIETDISLTLRKVAAGTLAAAKYYVRVVATVGTTEIICKYATETITDQDVIDGNRELYASWAAVTGASSYKIYVGTKRFAMRLKATQAGTTLSIQSPAAGGAAVSPEPSVYYYKVFDFAPGIWEAGGKIIEAAINDSLVDNDDKASTRALAFWEEKGIAERTWEFDTFETEVPMVGEVIPFVWVADDTAEPLMVKGIKAKLLGDRVYYTVIVGDDPLLTKRGVTQIFADMQAATARLNDTIAPEAPQSLVVTAPVEALLQTPDGVTRASVTAQWTPSPEDDFAHYSVEYGYDPNFTEVQRANVSQTSDSQSASTGVKANVVHTFQAEPGRTLYYRVAAIDNTNNKSPWSSEEIELPQDETPCEAPYNALVAPGLKSNTVTWQFDFYSPESPLLNTENTDFARFRVYRRVHNTGAYAVIAETSATQYVDTDFADYSAGYNYAVTSLDRTGNESGTPGSGGATGVAYNTTSSVPSKIDGGVDITTASITGAEIANATITDANIGSINADKINAGTLNVSTGMTIVSDGTAAAPQFEVGPNGIIIRDDDGNTVLEVNGSTANLNADFLTVTGVEATEITVGSGDSVVRVGNYPNSVSPTFQGIWGGNANPSSAAFTLSTSGAMTATSASVTGSVTANSGAIGGWSLTSTSLSGGDTTIASTGDITVGSGANIARISSSDPAYRLWLGGTTASTAPFRVTSTGSFVATSANVTGTISTSDITATGGTVGGWTLSSSSLTAGSGVNSVGINATGAGPTIFAGSSSGPSAPFQVSNNGAVQAKNITVLGGQVLIGEIGPEIAEISLAATTGIVTVTTTASYDTDKYSVGAKILIDTSGTYASAPWANGYFIIASVGASTLTYQSEDLVSGPLSDSSAGGFIYLGSQMAVGGDGGSAAAWMTVEGNKFALRNPADPLVTVIEATAGAVTINADFINAGSLNIGDLDANALTATNFSVTNAGVMTAGSGNNVAVISPTDATYRLWLGHSTGAAAPFSVTSTGAISATSGSVGGWTLSSTSFTGGDTIISSAGDITLGTGPNVARLSSSDPAYRLWLGGSTASTAPFRVTSAGSFTATDANISGTVTATSGAIGGWVLSSTSLTGGDTTISSTGDITVGTGSNVARLSSSDPAYRLWLGGSTASTAPFRVTSTGALTATGVDISGTISASSGSFTGSITATSGSIGGWLVDSQRIYNTLDSSPYIAGMQGSSTSTGIAFFAGGTTSTGETAAFQVNNQGAVTASNITATGGSVFASLLTNQPDQPLLITAGGTNPVATTQGGALPASTSGDIGIIGQVSSLLIANRNAYSQVATGLTLDPGSNPEGANVDQFYGGATGAVYTQTTEQAPGAVNIEYGIYAGQRQSSARLISSYANRFLIGSVARSGTTVTIKGIESQLWELILSGAVKVDSVFTMDLTLNSPDPTTYAQINGPGKIVTAVNTTFPGSISYTTATSASLSETVATGFYDLVDNVASSIETYALNWFDFEINWLDRSEEGVVTIGFGDLTTTELNSYIEVGSKVYINITDPNSTYSINEGWQTVTSVSDLEFPSSPGFFTYSSTGGEVYPPVEIVGTASIRNVYSKSGFLIRAGGLTGGVYIGANDYDRVLDISAGDEVNIDGGLKGITVTGSARFSSNGLYSGTVPGDEETSFNLLDYAQFSYPEGIVVGSKVSTDLGGFSYGGASIAFEAYDDTEEFAQFPVYLYLKEEDPASGQAKLGISSSLDVEGNVTATGDMSANGIGVNFLWGNPSKTGPVFQLAGVNDRAWSISSSAGAADLIASNSTGRAGILITKSCVGQPSTVVNGTANNDAFADRLINGGIALDGSNNRAYFYSTGWKYANLITPSDSRLKEEITEISGAIDTLRQLMPVAFKWKAPEAHQRTDCVADDGTRMGFIADHVATTDLAHWVETLGVDDREAHLVDTTEVLAVSIPQNEMEALLVQALLDIDTRLKALENA